MATQHHRTVATTGVLDSNFRAAQTDVAVIRCDGEMGDLELATICEEMFRLNSKGFPNVVLDLSNVSHLDYRGLPGLLRCTRALRASGGDLKLSGMSGYLATIIRATGFEDSFESYDSVSEAKRAFVSSLYCVRR